MHCMGFEVFKCLNTAVVGYVEVCCWFYKYELFILGLMLF